MPAIFPRRPAAPTHGSGNQHPTQNSYRGNVPFDFTSRLADDLALAGPAMTIAIASDHVPQTYFRGNSSRVSNQGMCSSKNEWAPGSKASGAARALR